MNAESCSDEVRTLVTLLVAKYGPINQAEYRSRKAVDIKVPFYEG